MQPWQGNTPTGVGKTTRPPAIASCIKKHPHGRGEDGLSIKVRINVLETPPRAWGRLLGQTVAWSCYGNTPTGVGKTNQKQGLSVSRRKHPHGRGEDLGLPITEYDK